MTEQPLASLSLTQVHYDPTDPLSHLCAWASLLPQALCLIYVTLSYTTREIEILLTFGGQLTCEALNWGLKRWIKEARPDRIKALGKGYGMPSSHAQFVGFFAVYVGLFLMFRHAPSLGSINIVRRRARDANGAVQKHVPLNADPYISGIYALQLHYPRLTHALLTAGNICIALFVCFSRIYLGYHHPRQVFVGLAIGIAYAILWFSLIESARRRGLVQWLLEWELLRMCRIRDLLCEEDLVELGWQVWEEKRQVVGPPDARLKRTD